MHRTALATLSCLALFVVQAPLVAAASPPVRVSAPLTPPIPDKPPVRPDGAELRPTPGPAEAHAATFADGRTLWLTRQSTEVPFTAQVYDAQHEPVGAAVAVGPPGPATVAVEALADDSWVFVWIGKPCGSCPENVFLSVFEGTDQVSELEPVLPDNFLEIAPAEPSVPPAVAFDGVDRFVVGWTIATTSEDGVDLDATARLFDATGNPASNIFPVNLEFERTQVLSGATFLGNGDLVLVWEEDLGPERSFDVLARHFRGDGFPLTDEIVVHEATPFFDGTTTGIQRDGNVTALGDDGYLVAWVDEARPGEEGPAGGILARIFDDTGAPEREIRVTAPGEIADYSFVSAAANDSGSYAVQWTATCGEGPRCVTGVDGPDGSGSGVFARTFSVSFPFGGRFIESAPFVVPVDTLGDQVSMDLQPLADGSFLSTWASADETGGPLRPLGRVLRSGSCRGLCLDDERFEITVQWEDFSGGRGVGRPQQRDQDWGTFWFFQESAVDLAAKVLDGTTVNQHYWLFFASLTNVQYTVESWDLVSGAYRRYENPSGSFGSVGDAFALPAAGPPPTGGATYEEASLTRDQDPGSGVDDRPGRPTVALENTPFRTEPRASTLAPCNAEQLCLVGDRFLVEIDWRDFVGDEGSGTGTNLSQDSAWFWFFDQGNPEVLVKILDGGPINGRFWVFYGALSNVAFELTITDRTTDTSVTYSSPLEEFAAAGDTSALPSDSR